MEIAPESLFTIFFAFLFTALFIFSIVLIVRNAGRWQRTDPRNRDKQQSA